MHASSTIVIAATIFSAFVTVAVLIDGPAPLVLDAGAYWQYGESVAQGDWLLRKHAIAYRTPGYPWFLALCQSIAGDNALGLAIALQGLMCVAMVPMTAWIVAAIAPYANRECASAVVAILMSLAVSRLYFARTILGETLFIFVLLVHLMMVINFVNKPSKYLWATAAGVSLSLMILVRPIGQWLWLAHFAYAVPTVLANGTIQQSVAPKKWLLSGLLLACVSIVILMPWWYRNAVMFGKPFLTEFIGRNIWIVTFQDQSGAGLPIPKTAEAKQLIDAARSETPEVDLVKTWEVSNALTRSGLADDKADRLMLTVAMQAISESPATWFERFARRAVNFFRCISDARPAYREAGAYPESQNVWHHPNALERMIANCRLSPHLFANMLITFAFALACVRLFVCKNSRAVACWLGLMIAYFAIVTAAIEIPDYRYRLVVDQTNVFASLGSSDLDEMDVCGKKSMTA